MAVGLDTPGPSSSTGVLSARGATNFVHPHWAGFDIRKGLEALKRPVLYLNDGNAGALWGHFTIFGANSKETSISAVIGTGIGGGVIVEGNVVKGRMVLAGNSGTYSFPIKASPALKESIRGCNCGRTGDLESLCSLTAIAQTLLPYFLARYPGHDLARLEVRTRRNSSVVWRKRAIRCAGTFSGFRLTPWAFFSTRWSIRSTPMP